MPNLTSEQASQLADNFYYLGMAIGEFRYANWDRLSLEENKELSEMQNSILRCGEDILAYATKLIMDEVATSLVQINTISQEIKGSIKTLKNIQKGLNVAAVILILGVAIVNRKPDEISSSLKDLVDTWNTPLD
ncbi:MAG: hypothetical protein ABJH96_08215 [Algoriphagus sp.]|uniref:hypothetical protein n=1 Tax=Algoriphagus sp. TaxID=1872435 RepID=UPI003298807A